MRMYILVRISGGRSRIRNGLDIENLLYMLLVSARNVREVADQTTE